MDVLSIVPSAKMARTPLRSKGRSPENFHHQGYENPSCFYGLKLANRRIGTLEQSSAFAAMSAIPKGQKRFQRAFEFRSRAGMIAKRE